MSKQLFNSTFEMELRVMSLLSIDGQTAYSLEKILALDFIDCYAGKFGLPYFNLHGNGLYLFGEISNRRVTMQEAIKKLVVHGLITPIVDRGYFYKITDTGKKYISSFESDYAKEYIIIASTVVKAYGHITDSELMGIIEDKSVSELKGVN